METVKNTATAVADFMRSRRVNERILPPTRNWGYDEFVILSVDADHY
jgi:hypothetical protein